MVNKNFKGEIMSKYILENSEIKLVGSEAHHANLLTKRLEDNRVWSHSGWKLSKKDIAKRAILLEERKAEAEKAVASLLAEGVSKVKLSKEMESRFPDISEFRRGKAIKAALTPKKVTKPKSQKEPRRNGFLKNPHLEGLGWGYINPSLVMEELSKFDADTLADELEDLEYI